MGFQSMLVKKLFLGGWSLGIFLTSDSRQNEVKDKLLLIHSNIENLTIFFYKKSSCLFYHIAICGLIFQL